MWALPLSWSGHELDKAKQISGGLDNSSDRIKNYSSCLSSWLVEVTWGYEAGQAAAGWAQGLQPFGCGCRGGSEHSLGSEVQQTSKLFGGGCWGGSVHHGGTQGFTQLRCLLSLLELGTLAAQCLDTESEAVLSVSLQLSRCLG